MSSLPLPEPGPDAAIEWVAAHLGHLACDEVAASLRFRGGQRAADAALAGWDVRGYAARRNEVWPARRRGASQLSPYIRHGLLPLSRVWEHVADGPSRDVSKFRDELLWQEYARHLYARLGDRLGTSLRARWPSASSFQPERDPWTREMLCMEQVVGELESDGWLVNQTRMWLASQWTVRAGVDWREGEEHFFRHLLDGSRAANRMGWQWTVGTATGRPYAFTRWQVEKRAPGLCPQCKFASQCPIADRPRAAHLEPAPAPQALATDSDVAETAGPEAPVETGRPDGVWITAESLGRDDPALAAHPDLPAWFVFDEPLLARLRLSSKRLVFLVETLAEIAAARPLELRLGRPRDALAGRSLAVTFAPVPGFRRLLPAIGPVVLHPWPWLRRPHAGPLRSFSAWRSALGGRSRSRRPPPKLRRR